MFNVGQLKLMTVGGPSTLSFVLQKYPKHAKYHFVGPDNLSQMEVMFDKAYVIGHLSTLAGPVDFGSEKDTEPAEEEEVPNLPNIGESSGARRQSKGKAKRKRGSSGIVDDNGFLEAYKGALDRMTASCETSSRALTPASTTPSIAECMAMTRVWCA